MQHTSERIKRPLKFIEVYRFYHAMTLEIKSKCLIIRLRISEIKEKKRIKKSNIFHRSISYKNLKQNKKIYYTGIELDVSHGLI